MDNSAFQSYHTHKFESEIVTGFARGGLGVMSLAATAKHAQTSLRIAAVGIAVGSVMFGLGRLIDAFRNRRSDKK